MARTTRSDSAANFGKSDDVLKEFAKGEDVGHGPDHDCPQCRQARKGLKDANLHASDIKGLGGGKPPAASVTDIPEAERGTRSIEEIAASNSAAVEQMMSTDPNDRSPDAIDRAIAIAEDLRRVTTDAHGDEDVLTFARRIDVELASGRTLSQDDQDLAKNLFPERVDLDRVLAAGKEAEAKAARIQKISAALDRSRALITRLNEALEAAFAAHGIPLNGEEENDIDLAQILLEHKGARFMLMKGYVPDDTNWHCEIEVGGNRGHVKQPRRHIAVMLAALLALDPKAGAPLHSQFEQVRLESQKDPSAMWSGLGPDPR